MSHTTAAWGILRGVFHGETTTIISVGQSEADEVLKKAKDHRAILIALGSRMAATRDKDTQSQIDFASGGRVMALPSSGGRGFTGNIFLDEFAYHQHPERVWDAALAVTMHGFCARVTSTPNGVGNEFHALWSDPEKNRGWARHEISLDRALGDGMRVSTDDCWKMAKGDPRIFDQLFRCKFLDGELQYLPTSLIRSAEVDDLRIDGGVCFAGLDIGKTADLTVLCVLRKVGKVSHVQYLETHRRTDADGLHAMVARAFKAFDLRRLCVDATGLGSFPAEQMRKRHGLSRVEPIQFTLQEKEELATGLYTTLTEGTIRLPRTDTAFPAPPPGMHAPENGAADNLREDLCSLRRIITTSGNVRYDAPHTDRGHADRAWALALAAHAASQSVSARGVGTVSLGLM